MSDLLVRTLTGIALIVLALMAAFVGGYSFAIFVAAAATAMFYEWRRLVAGWGIGWSIAGFVYALLPALALLWIRDRGGLPEAPRGFELLLWVFIVTWATDIGAYFSGRAFGRKKLAPSISPGKTWAGLWGGALIAGLAAAAWVQFAKLPPALYVLAPLFGLTAQAGDLFESWLKRRSGAKDSGNWLPGHGGILDRLDGLVPVALLTAAADLVGLV